MVGRARIEIDALGKFVNLVADPIVTVPLRDYRLWSDLRPLPPALEGHLVINIATNCGGIGISLNGTDRCGHQEDKKGTNQANHLSIIEGSSEPITGSKMNSSEDAANVRLWLQADMPSSEIDFRFAPNTGHFRWDVHGQRQQTFQIEIRLSISCRTSSASNFMPWLLSLMDRKSD